MAGLLWGGPDPGDGPRLPATRVEEHLGVTMPLAAPLVTGSGGRTTLGELLDGRPTVLTFVYYTCPGICSPLLSGAVSVFDTLQLTPGEAYRAVTISFDHRETAELARQKKANYYRMFDGDFPEDAWEWTVADSATIQSLTQTAGFPFVATESGTDFIHPAALIVLAPDGRLVRYLSGVFFEPFDLRLAILEATPPDRRSLTEAVLLAIYEWDGGRKRYALNAILLWSALAIGVGLFALAMWRSVRRHNRETAADPVR